MATQLNLNTCFQLQLFQQYPCTDLHCYIYCKILLSSTPFYPRLGEVGWKPGCKPYWIVEYKFIITSFEEFLNSTTSKAYIVQATKLQVWQTSKKIKIPTWHFISIHRFNMLKIRKFKPHFLKIRKFKTHFIFRIRPQKSSLNGSKRQESGLLVYL